MLYAQMTNRELRPLGWEQSEWLFKKLQQLSFDGYTYQFVWERRLFALPFAPDIRATLVKWHIENGQKIREEIVQTTDQQVMASALTMLVAVAEDREKELKSRGEIVNGIQWY